MKLNKLVGVLAAASLLSTGSAFAAQIYLNSPNPDNTVDANSLTSSFTQFSLNWTAKSTYTDANGNGSVDAGEAVVDTVEQNYFKDGLTTLNYFGQMGGIPDLFDDEGFEDTWGLYFDYTLNGTVLSASGSSILANYTSGTINIYYDDYVGRTEGDRARDPSSDSLVMSIDVTGSGGDVANFLLYGEVATVNPNLFFFTAGNKDFNELLGAGLTISARVDTNLDTNAIPQSAGDGQLARVATLDGSAEFSVPEPGSLALLGLGLLGAGVVRRIKKAA